MSSHLKSDTFTTKDGLRIFFKDWYKGFPHGMITTQAYVINPDILAFIKS